MHQSGSVSLCRSAISVLVATALYSPIALASTVEYGETVDGVVLEKDIQLVYGTANNTKINPGGEQHIKEFGVSNNTEINGGYQYIEMNGAAEYSVLNDGYQIVQMGGAANQTTLNNGVLQVYGAANEPTIKGGRLIIEKDGITVFAAIEKGGLLEVKEGGFAFAVDQKAGGAIKTTTRAMEVFGTNRLGQFDIKDGIANNMLLENGGSLRVEENDFAYNTTVDSGGLLEVMDGGTVTGVDKKAGGKLIVSTNALEVSGPNSKGQFSIKDGVSKNYELDDGSGLIVMEDTQAIDTILDKHATMQSLGKDTGTKVQANAVYDLGRSYQNGSITYSSKAISENMVINNGRANVWAGTMVNVSVRGNDGILEVMKPQINYAPAMLVGKVVVSEGASFRTHGAVDTSKADVSLENSVWTIIADITTTNQNTLLNLANLAMSDANVIMMDEPVTRSSVTASAENFITLTTNTLSGNGNFYMRTDMANHQSDQLNVTGQATGDFKIFVTDTGASPAAGDSLTLVTTGGGDAAFTLTDVAFDTDIDLQPYSDITSIDVIFSAADGAFYNGSVTFDGWNEATSFTSTDLKNQMLTVTPSKEYGKMTVRKYFGDVTLEKVIVHTKGSAVSTTTTETAVITTEAKTTIETTTTTAPAVTTTMVTTVTEAVNGDVNGDGTADLTDLVMLQKYLVRKGTMTAEQSSRADLNADHVLNVVDAMLLRQLLLKQA